MKRILSQAFCALALISISTERRAPLSARVAFAQQAGKAQAAATGDATVVVRELDLEGLKKLLPRDGMKDARPLLINFWATWCEPCREEFPDMVKIEADYRKRGLELVFVSLDDPTDIKTAVPQFLREMHGEKLQSYLMNLPEPELAIKEADPEWKGAIALPVTFLFDAQGKIVFRHRGRVKPDELRAALDTLIKK
jgi:thiol-disulfide isomerase/thioredoxin